MGFILGSPALWLLVEVSQWKALAGDQKERGNGGQDVCSPSSFPAGSPQIGHFIPPEALHSGYNCHSQGSGTVPSSRSSRLTQVVRLSNIADFP